MEITRKQPPVATGNVINLGKYGHAEEVPDEGQWPEPARFPWFGVEVRVNPTLTDTALVDMLEKNGELDDKDPRAAIAVKEFIREVIHPADFDDFWKLGKMHGYSTMEFADVAATIIQVVTGDPTQGSSGSSATQLPTATKSPGDSYSQTIEDLEGEGRPDLAEFFLLAREHAAAT